MCIIFIEISQVVPENQVFKVIKPIRSIPSMQHTS